MPKIVTEEDLPKYTPAYLGAIKLAWETKKEQTYWEYIITPRRFWVSVRLRGRPRVLAIFPRRVIEKIKFVLM